MSQSDRSQSDDLYREAIEDSDLSEKSLFPQENNIKKEENSLNFVKKKEQIEDEKPIPKEDFPQQSEIVEEKPIQNNPSIKESLMNGGVKEKENVEIEEKKLGEAKPIEQKTEDIPQKEEIKPAEQREEDDSSQEKDVIAKEEPIIIVKKEVSDQPVIEIKEKPSLNKNQAPIIEAVEKESLAVETEKEETIQKEIPQVKKSYKELRDELWNKVNPANADRFSLLNIEETNQNKAFLNDIAVKITFLDDDLEDSLISEDDAMKKIKELENEIKL
ncbi:MAG: hypothetical protein PHY30_02450 [Candidatus Pacebacteria bacterium]|nr:hypothetical protein [Candidatus Paceibacterota bacterium]